MGKGKTQITNTRRNKAQTNRQLVVLVLLTLVGVGGLVITLVYGPIALITALPFLLGGVVLILVPYGLLVAIEKGVERMEEKARQEMDDASP